MFRRVKGDVWGDETWSLARSKLSFRSARAKLSQNEEWRMKSEESVFTQFNFYFITFPRQVFVGIFHVIFPLKEGIPICNHFLHSNQSMNTRPCSGGLKDQQPYSQRQRLGLYIPCNNSAPEGGKSIFLLMITLLPCQGAVYYVTLVPQGVALSWWLIAPFRGAFGIKVGGLWHDKGNAVCVRFVLCRKGRNADRH